MDSKQFHIFKDFPARGRRLGSSFWNHTHVFSFQQLYIDAAEFVLVTNTSWRKLQRDRLTVRIVYYNFLLREKGDSRAFCCLKGGLNYAAGTCTSELEMFQMKIKLQYTSSKFAIVKILISADSDFTFISGAPIQTKFCAHFQKPIFSTSKISSQPPSFASFESEAAILLRACFGEM